MGRRNRRKHTPDEVAKAERKELLSICNHILEVATGPTPQTAAKQWEEFLEIHNQLKKIQTKQQNDHLFTTSRSEHLKSFTNWIKENGVSMDKVRVAEYGDEGYGMEASEDIKADEIFLSIPRKLMMTDEEVRASELGPLVKSDRILSTMPHVALALFLLGEKLSGTSFWQPYIDFLPQSYSLPLYYGPEELEYLKGSPTLAEALKQHKNIARQYAYFYKLFQHNSTASKLALREHFTYNAYRWAVCTIMSRQNQIPNSTGSGLITALIPKWDMCNHASGTITTGYNFNSASSESQAERDFKTGQQLNIFYGARPNSHFLLYSGFVYSDNKHDTLAIQLGVSKNDRLYAMKVQILAMLRMADQSQTFFIRKTNEPVAPDLWAFLRVFSMDEEQLKALLLGPNSRELMQNLTRPNCLVSKENELKVWSYLEVRLRLLLQQYKAGTKDACEQIASEELSYNAKLGIRLRQSEMEVLENAIDQITAQKLVIEDLAKDALYYRTEGAISEPPLASEENSDVNTGSRNSREYDSEETPDLSDEGSSVLVNGTTNGLDDGHPMTNGSILSDSESTLTIGSDMSQATQDASPMTNRTKLIDAALDIGGELSPVKTTELTDNGTNYSLDQNHNTDETMAALAASDKSPQKVAVLMKEENHVNGSSEKTVEG